jgi:hypothetical protein
MTTPSSITTPKEGYPMSGDEATTGRLRADWPVDHTAFLAHNDPPTPATHPMRILDPTALHPLDDDLPF